MRKTLIAFLIIGCLLNIGIQIYGLFFLKNDDTGSSESPPTSTASTTSENDVVGKMKESANALLSIALNKPDLMPKKYTDYPVPAALSTKPNNFSPVQAKESIEQKEEQQVQAVAPASPATDISNQPATQPQVAIQPVPPPVAVNPNQVTSQIGSLPTDATTDANTNKLKATDTNNLVCLVWGPLTDDTLTKAQLLMETYDKDFTDKVKSYEFNKKDLWYVATKNPVSEKEQAGKLKFWQNSGINVEKVIFLNDGRAWLNTFTDEKLANSYVADLAKKKIEAILVQDQKSEIYYYIVNPSPTYAARMRAFGLYFSDTQTIETNCLDNQNYEELRSKFNK